LDGFLRFMWYAELRPKTPAPITRMSQSIEIIWIYLGRDITLTQ
jgi:hypothetical protein